MVKKVQGTHKSAKKSIKLTTLGRNGLEYITEHVIISIGAVNHVKINQYDASEGP
jgi:hypothetical protein